MNISIDTKCIWSALITDYDSIIDKEKSSMFIIDEFISQYQFLTLLWSDKITIITLEKHSKVSHHC